MTQGKIVKDFVVPGNCDLCPPPLSAKGLLHKALRAWGLLCTSLSDSFINNEGGERIIAWLKSLDALLECTEVDVERKDSCCSSMAYRSTSALLLPRMLASFTSLAGELRGCRDII
eukprot:749671-Hanusia_phi.AAC.3